MQVTVSGVCVRDECAMRTQRAKVVWAPALPCARGNRLASVEAIGFAKLGGTFDEGGTLATVCNRSKSL